MKLQPLAWFLSLHKVAVNSSEGIAWKGQWLIGLCLIGFVVFTWLPMSYFRMVGWPWIGLWQLGFLCAGSGLIWMLRQFSLTFRGLGYGLDWLMLFTSAGLLLASVLSSFPVLAVWNLVLVVCYSLVLYSVRNLLVAAPRKVYFLWAGLVATIWITAIISLSYWRPDPSMWAAGNFRTAIRNAFPLGHHNFVGGYFALAMPLSLCFAMTQYRWLRWFFGILSGVVLLALYVSGSRGAYLGFLVYFTASMVVALWRSRGNQRKRLMVFCIVGLLIILAGIVTNPRVRGLISGIQIGSTSTTTVQVGDGPTRDRWFMLKTAGNILRDRPFFGVGPGNMPRVSNLYRPIETGTGLDHVQQLHNTPAQLAGEVGLWGIAIYLGWLWMWGRLWLRLYRQILTSRDRWLLYGIGGSTLAYVVSSLTDYQLENIGISTVLTLNTALLLYLADQYLKSTPYPQVSKRLRRISSLGIFVTIAIALRAWLPMDTALYLGHLGNQQMQAKNFAEADQRWSAAASLVPWDPTYAALSGAMLYELEALADDGESQAVLQAGVIEHFEQMVEAAPNDVWFNQNLAIAYLNQANLPKAERYASLTIQLLPRNRNKTYFLLGTIYLAQNRPQDAAVAFALEGLVDPMMVLLPQWGEPPLIDLHEQVLQTCRELYDQLLTTLTPSSIVYQQVYTTRVLLNWWFGQPIAEVDLENLSSVAQALLKTEVDPAAALAIIQRTLEQTPNEPSLVLLQAWIDPENYLDSYLALEGVPETTKAFLQADILQTRDLHLWVKSTWQSESDRLRSSLSLAYRNFDARAITLLLKPPDLQTNFVADSLTLFPDYPREFPQLETLIETVRTDALNLPHPTYNHFQLTDSE